MVKLPAYREIEGDQEVIPAHGGGGERVFVHLDRPLLTRSGRSWAASFERALRQDLDSTVTDPITRATADGPGRADCENRPSQSLFRL